MQESAQIHLLDIRAEVIGHQRSDVGWKLCSCDGSHCAEKLREGLIVRLQEFDIRSLELMMSKDSAATRNMAYS